ncbi:MAG: flagellar hook-basal body complex protein [Verrucomicrobiota bacterium]|jgi:flagellar hook-basal body protein|nr:flagellar hook-basal body complex protein [Verrucomicrobiota bacterium]
MIRSLNTGVGGIRNYQTSLDVIANNLANLNTVGFKGGRVDFAEALTQTVRPSTPDEGNTSGSSSVAVSNGVATNSVTTIFGQGAINQTGKITDLALAGDGYFIVKKYGTASLGGGASADDGAIGAQGIAQPDSGDKGAPGGVSFATRAGDFRLDKNGNLVNNMGMRVQGISDYINNPGEIGDIKFDRGEFMASVDVLRGSTDNKTIVMAKAHGFRTGNIVIFKSDGDMPGTELQEATPYYVRVVDDNKLLLYGDLHSASTDSTVGHQMAKSVPADEITITGMRIIKKLASYEGVHTVGINEENTISSNKAHGLKDGDNVRFYIPNSVNITAGTMIAVDEAGQQADENADGFKGNWQFTIPSVDYKTSMTTGKVLNFGVGKELVIESVVEQGDEHVIKGTVAGRDPMPSLAAETKFTLAPLMSLVTTVDIADMATTGTDDQWSFNLAADDYSSLAPINTGTVLNFGPGKELRVGTIEKDQPLPGRIKVTGTVILADSQLTGMTRLSHEGFNPLGNLDDQDSSGGFSQTFFVSVKGEKGFTIHNSSEDAFSRLRAVKIDSGSLYNSSLIKVAVTTTSQIQNVNVDTAGRVNVMLTDGTQYTRGQILLRKFTNQQALGKEGGNMYSNLENAGVSEWSTPGSDGFARIEAGALELSNVDVAKEFSKLISTQRAFQANARMVSASDQILQELLRLKR